ncbi:Uncharacterized protein DBV15_05768 [Temnothorax longispinosus]|uniref:Uncharacterized protein n=1 Tax=Temnothorax longispinosus TaxID=300112 RepID=A0A4S2KF51_9HYME|nr:Uncharacterized protein DBV15_05768 [Temnothorax longispinosus]
MQLDFQSAEIPSCDKATLGDRRQLPHDFPSVPFTFPALSTYVQSKFSAPSLRDDDNDNGAKTATARRRRARRRMRRVVGKRWSQTKRESKEIVARKNVIAIELGRTETQESRKSLIRCSRQRNSSLAESRGKGEERAKEKGWPSRCAATRSGRRIKNSPRLTNVVESIAVLSIAVESKRAEAERSERTAPFESGMESSNSRSRYVPFRPIS